MGNRLLRPIITGWVFKIEYHSTGELEKLKARLAARGITQCYGVA